MGQIIERTEDMGEYGGEIRENSFLLRGASDFESWHNGQPLPPAHMIFVYPRVREGVDASDVSRIGSVEIDIADIPKIRAVLDAVEAEVLSRR